MSWAVGGLGYTQIERDEESRIIYSIVLLYYTLQCFRHTVVLKDTSACYAMIGIWTSYLVSALISPNWLFILSLGSRCQTTVLLGYNVGDSGCIVNQNSTSSSWAYSACMNNSNTAEFSSALINAIRIQWRYFPVALILLLCLLERKGIVTHLFWKEELAYFSRAN